MRRYTARLRTLAPLGEAQIKAAIESELLRAPITFKLGAVALTEGDVARWKSQAARNGQASLAG